MQDSSFWTGTPSRNEQVSTLSPQQQSLQNQLMQMLQGGGLNQLQQYYGNILGDDEESFNQFAAPEMRRFQQEIVPSLANQFAGMGSGALSSSGFRNAAVGAGADLGERIAQLRANLRQNAAQGIQSMYGQAQQPSIQNVFRPQQPGFLQSSMGALGGALGSFGGPTMGALGQGMGTAIGQRFFGEQKDKTQVL